MGELSDSFAELMARLAKSDAALFRAIGSQNANLRQLVDELAPAESAIPASVPAPAADLPAAGLLPPEACDIKALKARFGKVADAQAWVEGQIGPAPKKPTWAVIAQTCLGGAWPESPARRALPSKSLTTVALEERLAALEQRLEHQLERRFNRLESLLGALANALDNRQALGSGPPSASPSLPATGSPPVD